MYKTLRSGRTTNSALEMIVNGFSRPGIFLELAMVIDRDRDIWETFDTVAETGVRDEQNVAILESLGLVRSVVLDFDVPLKRNAGVLNVVVRYYHLTQLGVEFCKVCSRPRADELDRVDDASRQKELKRQEPFWREP
jgi:hypothetical protein